MIVTALSAIAALGAAAWNQHANNKATKKQQELNKEMEAQNIQDNIRSQGKNEIVSKGQIENVRRMTDDIVGGMDNSAVAGNQTTQQRLAAKNAVAKNTANATNNIVANQMRADAVKDEQYMGRAKALNAVDQAYKGQEARSRDALTANLIGSIGDVAATFEPYDKKASAMLETIDNQNAVNEGLKNMKTPKVDMTNKTATPVSLADLNNDKGIQSVVNKSTGTRDFNVMGDITEIKDYDPMVMTRIDQNPNIKLYGNYTQSQRNARQGVRFLN